ncbi:hypothetical protein [Pseudoalteromonas rubra]|nr:hypothetical protein [Pseudoalteromonas rubra]
MKIRLLFALFLPVMANASDWSAVEKVTSIGIRADGTQGIVLRLESKAHNPSNCSLEDHYFIRNTNPMYDEMFSLILAAKKSGSEISVKVNGCDNGRPKVIWVSES